MDHGISLHLRLANIYAISPCVLFPGTLIWALMLQLYMGGILYEIFVYSVHHQDIKCDFLPDIISNHVK